MKLHPYYSKDFHYRPRIKFGALYVSFFVNNLYRIFKRSFFFQLKCQNVMHDKCINTQSGGYGEVLSVSHCYSDIGSNLVRLNMEGEMSYEEQCIHSDGDVIKKKFCLDSKGVWTPKGEWDYDEVRLLNIDFKRIEKKILNS